MTLLLSFIAIPSQQQQHDGFISITFAFLACLLFAVADYAEIPA